MAKIYIQNFEVDLHVMGNLLSIQLLKLDNIYSEFVWEGQTNNSFKCDFRRSFD